MLAAERSLTNKEGSKMKIWVVPEELPPHHMHEGGELVDCEIDAAHLHLHCPDCGAVLDLDTPVETLEDLEFLVAAEHDVHDVVLTEEVMPALLLLFSSAEDAHKLDEFTRAVSEHLECPHLAVAV